MSETLLVRMNEQLLKKINQLSKRLGCTRSEVIRKAVREFDAQVTRGEHTSKMRGLVKSRISLERLEELYSESRT